MQDFRLYVVLVVLFSQRSENHPDWLHKISFTVHSNKLVVTASFSDVVCVK